MASAPSTESALVTPIARAICLPRYGLGNYILTKLKEHPTTSEAKTLSDLSRSGKRLMGFCRTNLFKRLESNGPIFLQSVERHILRNYIVLHAIEHNLPIPIGTQDAGLLNTGMNDVDIDALTTQIELFDDDQDMTSSHQAEREEEITYASYTEDGFKKNAADAYKTYTQHFKKRFKWLRPDLFNAMNASLSWS